MRATVSQTITVTGDTTVNVDLPARTDTFGYACTSAAEAYLTVTDKLPH